MGSIFQESLIAAKGEIAKHAQTKAAPLLKDDAKAAVGVFFDSVLEQLQQVLTHMYGDELVMRRKKFRPDVDTLQIVSAKEEGQTFVDLMVWTMDAGRNLSIATYQKNEAGRVLPKDTVAFFALSDRGVKGLRLPSATSVSAADEVGAFLSNVVARLPRVPEGKSLPTGPVSGKTDSKLVYL